MALLSDAWHCTGLPLRSWQRALPLALDRALPHAALPLALALDHALALALDHALPLALDHALPPALGHALRLALDLALPAGQQASPQDYCFCP